jgi:hypothetical protein
VSLSQAFDWQIENCQWYGCGVGVAFIGSDINLVINCRMQVMGWFAYDLRISSFGSQNKFEHCDLLYNYRACGFALNGIKYFKLKDCYYENYNLSACLIYAYDTEGIEVTGNRIDDTTNGVTGPYPPLIIFDSPIWYNKVQNNWWQEFNTSWPTTVTRIIGTPSADGYHPESVVYTDNSTWFPVLTADLGTALPGVRVSPLDPTRWDVTNSWRPIPGAPFVLQNGEYAAYTTGATYLTPVVKLPSNARSTVYMRVRSQLVSGTSLSYSVRHYNAGGTVVESPIVGGTLTGLSSSAYTDSSITVTLGVPARAGDYLDFEWLGNAAYVSQLEASLVA